MSISNFPKIPEHSTKAANIIDNFNITNVDISDDKDSLTATCVLTIAPKAEGHIPVAELQNPFNSPIGGTAVTLRPNGAIVGVKVNKGSGVPWVVFEGYIEFMDDLEDADKKEFYIHLRNDKVGQAQRSKTPVLFNMIQEGVTTGENTTSTTVLRAAAAGSGTNLGRNDLPEHNIWGTYEALGKNAVDVARDLVKPFNDYPHQQYIVRKDTDGLQILRMDYTMRMLSKNVHTIDKITKIARTYEMYKTVVVSPKGVLLTGAQKTPNLGESTGKHGGDISWLDPFQPPVKEEPPPDDPTLPIKGRLAFDKEFFASSKNTLYASDKSAIKDDWVETTTKIRFILDYTRENSDAADEWMINTANFLQSFEDILVGIAAGYILTAQITDSFTLSSVTETFNNTLGLTQNSTQTFYYDFVNFTKLFYGPNDEPTRILVADETTTIIFPGKTEYLTTVVRREYGYSDFGQQNNVSTFTYRKLRDELVLKNIQVSTADASAEITSLLQYFLQLQARNLSGNLSEGSIRDTIAISLADRQAAYDDAISKGMSIDEAKTFAHSFGISNFPFDFTDFTQTLGGIAPANPAAKDPISRFQLLDGVSISSIPVSLLTQDANIGNITTSQVAMHKDVPYMDELGLGMLWIQIKDQVLLEQAAAYWSKATVTCSLDPTPRIGTQVIVVGQAGIVTNIHHEIDADKAISTFFVEAVALNGATLPPRLY